MYGKNIKALFETTPLYLLLEEKYSLPTRYNQGIFDAKAADTPVAGVLKVPEGTPVLHIQMIAFTYKNKPYEYRQAYCLIQQRSIFREI